MPQLTAEDPTNGVITIFHSSDLQSAAPIPTAIGHLF